MHPLSRFSAIAFRSFPGRRGLWGALFLFLGVLPPVWGDANVPPDNAAPPENQSVPPQPVPPEQTLSLRGNPAPDETTETTAAPNAKSSFPHFFNPGGDPGALGEHLLVVYNSKDPDSKELADYYALRRNIPPERVLGIACSGNEEITRKEYENTIREPIISYIYKQGWMVRRSEPVRVGTRTLDLLVATHNDIWAIVLMRGIPLKIAEDPTTTDSIQQQAVFQTNAAAVDSELAMLPVFGLPCGGFAPNPFFDNTGSGLVRAGPELANLLVLVTRLDGPSAAVVRRMIDDTLYAEEHRLAGLAVIDTRGITDLKDNYVQGDLWLRHAAELLLRDGWTVRLDANPEVIPPNDPLNQVALYLGWYRDGAYGPWMVPPDRFVRGAIAYHLHSFSASTIRSATAGWVGPLLAHGAAASMGTVYEPYLALTPQLDIFTRRLLDGDTFAEAAYASQRALSWMTTVVGDPLYRPFRKPLDAALADSGPSSSDAYDWLLLQKIRREFVDGELSPTVPALEQYLDVPGAVAQEGLGDLLAKQRESDAIVAAEGAYRNAEELYTQPIDRIRIGIKLAAAYEKNGEGERAADELQRLREAYPLDAGRYGIPAHGVAIAAPSAVTAAVSAPGLPQPPQPPRPPSP